MSDETKRCPFCDELIRANAVKCRFCGSMISGGTLDIGDPITALKLALASKYEILEEIGRGGMAVVFKALQKNLGRTVALKVLPQQFTHDREFLERFHREAREASKLSHPNIVTIFDEGIEQGVHYIAMEYLDGEDLHTYIRRNGPLLPSDAIVLIRQVAAALDHAHEQGVIHRDVKSANIIIKKNPDRPVLMDFGIAFAAAGTKLTRIGTVMGTPEYMSPEQADGREIDRRSDQYSLGVVLFECLTGQVPFRGDNPLTVIHKVVHEQPVSPSKIRTGLSPRCDTVMRRVMSKDPTARYASCREMVDALMGQNKADRSHPRRRISSRSIILSVIGVSIVILSAALIFLLTAPLVLEPSSGEPPRKDSQKTATSPAKAEPAVPVEVDRLEKSQEEQEREKEAAARARAAAQTREEKEALIHRLNLVLIDGGGFGMGSDTGDPDERPLHRVQLGSFYLARYEVTVAEYRRFCAATSRKMPQAPPWGWQDSQPIVNVTWFDANDYARWAGARLPTEAEWEYAAKGGKQGSGQSYSGGNNADEVAWHSGNSGRKPHPVGRKKPNQLGLYDMSGNVWEWCSDWYGQDYYATSPLVDPKGPAVGSQRVLRGGSWDYAAEYVTTTYRIRNDPMSTDQDNGFRCARDAR